MLVSHGQIGPEHIAQVAEKGFKSVINNRPDLEGGSRTALNQRPDEKAALVLLEVDVRTFANRFNELPKPVLMFCRTGNRSNNLYQIAKQMDLLDDE
ncbi:hypothetical protein FQR65_LT16895 [Abscondita terminalis]|nr:hypothetical protein FQR65_LT16895 [Abscondita terminalis]